MTITLQDLPAILAGHRKWLLGDPSGSRANLSRANLSSANLFGADLSSADLSSANLFGADLFGADLFGANLFGANLSRANLSSADLFGANLFGANLSRANLSSANLFGADLFGADLSSANLSSANLFGADLFGFKVAKGSKVAFAGPVGDSARVVLGFIAQPDDKHPKPFLVLHCGCFTGDKKQYKQRIAERYSDRPEYLSQCKAALIFCETVSKTWTIDN